MFEECLVGFIGFEDLASILTNSAGVMMYETIEKIIKLHGRAETMMAYCRVRLEFTCGGFTHCASLI